MKVKMEIGALKTAERKRRNADVPRLRARKEWVQRSQKAIGSPASTGESTGLGFRLKIGAGETVVPGISRLLKAKRRIATNSQDCKEESTLNLGFRLRLLKAASQSEDEDQRFQDG
ncbi:hypothetical protein B0H14DRAFT_2600200 [Mycena olivaceomarginata]|nr:hypothetical protein B0H14DRAFT_2600200 [Mycena olivaceomarginata]